MMRDKTRTAIQNLLDNKTEIYRWMEPHGWYVIHTPFYGVSFTTIRKYATYNKRPFGEGEMLTITGWKE